MKVKKEDKAPKDSLPYSTNIVFVPYFENEAMKHNVLPFQMSIKPTFFQWLSISSLSQLKKYCMPFWIACLPVRQNGSWPLIPSELRIQNSFITYLTAVCFVLLTLYFCIL